MIKTFYLIYSCTFSPLVPAFTPASFRTPSFLGIGAPPQRWVWFHRELELLNGSRHFRHWNLKFKVLCSEVERSLCQTIMKGYILGLFQFTFNAILLLFDICPPPVSQKIMHIKGCVSYVLAQYNDSTKNWYSFAIPHCFGWGVFWPAAEKQFFTLSRKEV